MMHRHHWGQNPGFQVVWLWTVYPVSIFRFTIVWSYNSIFYKSLHAIIDCIFNTIHYQYSQYWWSPLNKNLYTLYIVNSVKYFIYKCMSGTISLQLTNNLSLNLSLGTVNLNSEIFILFTIISLYILINISLFNLNTFIHVYTWMVILLCILNRDMNNTTTFLLFSFWITFLSDTFSVLYSYKYT